MGYFHVMRVPLALVTALPLMVFGCSKPAPPTITPERASITAVTAQGIDLHVELNAMNPNAVDLSAREVTAHIVVDKKYDMGSVTMPQAVTLAAGKATKLDVPVSTKWADLGSLVGLAASAGAVPYTVDGTVSLGGDLLNISVPFHLDGTVTHDQIVAATKNSLPALPNFLK